jgi:hypothetical protein
MRNSKVVFGNDVLDHGGGFDVILVDFNADRLLTSRKVEQLNP